MNGSNGSSRSPENAPSVAESRGTVRVDLSGQVLSVIVPARNAASTIGAQLEALASQTFSGRWELLIADNGSTDQTIAVAMSYNERFEDLRILDTSQRTGSAYARNVAAKEAVGTVLCFCDADDVVDRGWLEALAACAASNEVVAGRLDMVTLNDKTTRSWRPTPRAAAANPELEFPPSGNMAIAAAVFEEVGGFDADYAKSHDVELGHRLRSAGYSITFCQDAVIAYRLRSDLRGLALQAYRAGRASAQAFSDGRCEPRLLSASFADWGWLLLRIPTLVSPIRRGIWVRRAGESVGRLAGSIHWRVRYL